VFTYLVRTRTVQNNTFLCVPIDKTDYAMVLRLNPKRYSEEITHEDGLRHILDIWGKKELS
jgi:hypothetical protein